ncbi:15349_t:CDS:2 [Gigaspora rosea]|nr:15349_t:CDS:2 [Gigaspora rosea]
MDQIEFYIVHGKYDTTTIRNFLQSNYPDYVFLIQDLGNAIQKIKQEKGLYQMNNNSFEPFFDKEVDDDSEIPVEANEDQKLNLQSLITIVNPDNILKIWKLSRYGYSKCYHHISLLNNREYLCACFIPFKNEYIDSNKSCSKETTINNYNFKKGYKKISQDLLKFGTLIDEAKKVIQFAVQDNDDELIKAYNNKKEAQKSK